MDICKTCKNKLYCGKRGCPIYSQLISFKSKKIIEGKKDFFGDVPNLFVGRYGYPNVKVGMLSTENYMGNDNPKLWIAKDFEIDKIMDLRGLMVNSNFNVSIKHSKGRFIEMAQELALAKRPVDVEIGLDKKPKFGLISAKREAIPFGPSIGLAKASLCENVPVPKRLDKVVSDVDLKSVDALGYLSKHGYDEFYLTKVLSSGNLGVKTQRKLVPTRWSITAVDDTLGKSKALKVRDYRESGYKLFFGGYLGNYYLALVFPGPFSYELFEGYVGGPDFCTDYESWRGRKSYASSTAGGYYAARLGILEWMERNRVKGSVLLLRMITDEYYAPLGVWVVRTAVRKCMESKETEFDCKDNMINHVVKFAKNRFGYDLSNMIKASKLLEELKTQKRLFEF